MTETTGTDAARRPGPGLWTVAWAAVAAFLIVFILITLAMRSGHDPALARRPFHSRVPRVILIRKIYRRVVVVDVVPLGARARGRGSIGLAAPRSGSGAGSTAPPVPAVPVVTTRTS